MWIGDGVHALVLRTLVAERPLRHADEVALIGGEALNRFQVFAFGRILPGDIAENSTAEIGHVFALSELAVDLDVVNDGVLRVLIDNAAGTLFELLGIFRSPPIAQIALRIELA